MNKVISLLCAAVLLLSLTACAAENKAPTVIRSFLAGYEENMDDNGVAGRSSRVLLNLMSDGTAEIHVGVLDNNEHSTAMYTGTYTLGENAEFDETISLSYAYAEGKTAEITDAVIVDSVFEAPFHLPQGETPGAVRFYESAPADLDGDVYLGYLTKVGGMGPMVYCYALTLREDGTFGVSIMQMASVMHVFGGTSGTYAVDGENITFTYDIRATGGEVISSGAISEGTGFDGTGLMTAFNIAQDTMRASDAPFIKVK